MDSWSTSWALKNLLAEFLMPPGVWLVMIVLALMLIRRAWLKNILILVAVFGIWLTSTNFFALKMTQMADHILNWPAPLLVENHPEERSAVVILGGGKRKGAVELPQYQGQDISPQTVERLRHGARLARTKRIPILVSGGTPDRISAHELSEARVMAEVLKQEFGVEARWLEERSSNTVENWGESLALLERDQIKRVYLVTHFWHMPRVMQTVQELQKRQLKSAEDGVPRGSRMEIIPAPHGYFQRQAYTPLDFYPSTEGLQRTRWMFHELSGRLYYHIKFHYL